MAVMLLSLFSSFIFIKHCLSTTYYVDPDISSPGFGTSWATAYDNLDNAINSATSSIDEIFLKGGYTYIPSNPSDRTDCFSPRKGVKIYGTIYT